MNFVDSFDSFDSFDWFYLPLAGQGLFTMISSLICDQSPMFSTIQILSGFLILLTLVIKYFFRINWLWIIMICSGLILITASLNLTQNCKTWITAEMSIALVGAVIVTILLWRRRNQHALLTL